MIQMLPGQIIIILIAYRVISYFNMGSYFQVNFTAQPYFVSRLIFLPRSESEAGGGWREDGGSEGQVGEGGASSGCH